MKITLKKIVKAVGLILVLILAIDVLYSLTYFINRGVKAKKDVVSFCDSIKPGLKREEVEEIVKKSGADSYSYFDNKGKMLVIFNGFVFSHHICTINFQGNAVISAQRAYMN